MMLEIRDLRVTFGDRPALNGIDLSLARGRTLGVVGESGSGKSVMALAVMGLMPRTARTAGRIGFDGHDILTMPERDLCALRGNRIGMIFQEPMTALNPAMRIGAQIAEGLILHQGLSRRDARARVMHLLDMVRIPRAAERIDSFPHELSGGQRQRVGIAIALALTPDLLIADEPTTALDVTVQAEILDILDDLVADLGIALMLISHDLAVIARIADDTLVLYRGTLIEHGPTERILRRPGHDYTRTLLDALPPRVRATLRDAP